MGELETSERELEHFAASARAGRRNALPDLEIEAEDPGASKLADRLSDMTARCDDEAQPKTEKPLATPSKEGNS